MYLQRRAFRDALAWIDDQWSLARCALSALVSCKGLVYPFALGHVCVRKVGAAFTGSSMLLAQPSQRQVTRQGATALPATVSVVFWVSCGEHLTGHDSGVVTCCLACRLCQPRPHARSPKLGVDVRSSQGATALMFAADAGDEEVCALLLRAGADPFATDADGDDASAWAKARGHELTPPGKEGSSSSSSLKPKKVQVGKSTDNIANHLHARLKVQSVANLCPPWLRPQMTRVSDGLVHAQEMGPGRNDALLPVYWT
eukprot:Skav228910  [mRNA]  locus=scaffold2504:965:3202:+ [translate_table: standard]